MNWDHYYLSLEVYGVGLGLVLAHGDVTEGFLERQRRVDEDAVGEGDARAAGAGSVGEDELHQLLGERVEALGAPGPPSAEASWSRVAPPAPAATRLSATWRDSGEKATFLPAPPAGCAGEDRAAARRSAKEVWWAMETRRSAAMVTVGRRRRRRFLGPERHWSGDEGKEGENAISTSFRVLFGYLWVRVAAG